MVRADFSAKPCQWAPRLRFAHTRLTLLIFCALALVSTARAADQIIDPGNTLDLAGLQDQFQAIANNVSSSVVSISAASSDHTGNLLYADDLTGEKIEKTLDHESHIVGTGFVIDPAGLILTNEHVVGDTTCLWVTFDNGRTLPAMVLASDPRQDIAILKIPANGLHPVTFSTDPPQRGQWTFVLGNPFGLATRGNLAMSVGVVSATGRSLPKLSNREDRLYCNLIQTTAEINPGNSGGPLFDIKGRVIGISTAVIMPQKSTNGIGFAMPITDQFQQDLKTLSAGSEVVYGFLGVRVSAASAQERHNAGMTTDGGVIIDAIEAQTPAQRSGQLKPGDLIQSVAGQPIVDGDSFVAMVGRLPVGKPTLFNVYRKGVLLRVMISPDARPLPTAAVTRQRQRLYWQGMQLGPIPDNSPASSTPTSSTPASSSLSASSVPASSATASSPSDASSPATSPVAGGGIMVIAVDEGSPMLTRGARPGAILLNIAGKPVTAMDQLMDLLATTPIDQCIPAFDTPTVTSAVMMSREQ